MQTSFGAKRMVGASGASLTIKGELRRCPLLLNGYLYHVNLVIAELGTVDTILGMDFLTAYGVTINLKNDTVSLGARALIQQITECVDCIPVARRQCSVLISGCMNSWSCHLASATPQPRVSA